MNGILVVDKPKNFTSFDVIAKLRKKLSQKKIGHMGTLDPMATGVLPILLVDSAKFQIFSSNNTKSYDAKICFGIKTDTLDITGTVISQKKSDVSFLQFESVINGFIGEIYQTPPMFSAIKNNGIKLCNLARKGINIDRKKRKVFIDSIKIIDFDENRQEAKISVLCSKGTYIRSLCDDIGNKLGCGAALGELRRTLSNGFKIKDSTKLATILELNEENIKDYILPTEMLFEDLPTVNITAAQALRFKNGGNLAISRVRFASYAIDNKTYKIYCGKNFIGLGKTDINTAELKVLKCLR